MIQELFGGSNVGLIGGGGDRNKFDGPPSHNSPSPSSSAGAAAAAPTPENLRCPRCDSSNTKFCYYNNYNLTQPRHFCKTCRRYWTKGGALRNVPIGGGCRKNKPPTITAALGKPTPAGLQKTKSMSSDPGRPGIFSGFEHVNVNDGALSSNPIIWASSQNSHFLSLLRSAQNPIPNYQNAIPVKEESSPASLFASPHMSSDSTRALGFDHLGPAHLPSPFYRNQTMSSSGQGMNIMYGDQNAGIQEAYQRLRSSGNCYTDHAPLILGNTTSTGILDSSPVVAAGTEMGFWNPSTLSWPTDSAYP